MADSWDRSITVLHVDDDPEFVGLTAEVLEGANDRFDVTTATAASEALETLETTAVDCVVSDFQLTKTDGLALLDAVRDDHPDLPFILFTSEDSATIASEALAAGVTDYVRKRRGTEMFDLLENRVVNAVERYRARDPSVSLFQNTPDPVVEVRAHGETLVVTDANPAFEATFEAEASTLVGRSLADTSLAADTTQFGPDTLRRCVDGGDRVEGDVRRQTGDGVHEFRLRMIPFDSRAGPPGAYLWYTDISEQKRRERELRRLKSFNQEVVENAPVALFRLDEELRITYENPQAKRIIGLPEAREESEALGMDIRLIPSIADSGMDETFSRLRDGEDIDFEFQFESIYGKQSYVSGRAVPLCEDTEFTGAILMAVDITKQKDKERDLQRQNDRLEEFANIVSHDLRNPLSVASGNLDFLRREYDDTYADAIESSLIRMSQIIDDVLTMARAGQTVEATDEHSLAEIAEACWKTVETGTAVLDVEGDVTFEADHGRLQHVLENLFRNSVEHGGDGVTVRVGGHEDGFYVSDDGTGIPDAIRDRLFDEGFSTTDDGTGFGLNIVKQMVEAHGWEIAVAESESGGARFEVHGIDV